MRYGLLQEMRPQKAGPPAAVVAATAAAVADAAATAAGATQCHSS